ncbi:MAG: hypothetical protein A2V88_08565 [Elusimicrobia bacterium RBG_16_66_12]|nr:MAG: hypothetical protein A2V88_08565 [Elusimicrobia bacterium RBG_16_66_12]
MDLMIQWSTAELFAPSLGFTDAEIIILDDTAVIAALVSGEAWMGQTGTSLIWAAMDQGDVDLVIVGIDKDDEVRILGTRPGIASVADLAPGSKISGGDVGDWDELVLREILTELGVDPDTMDIIAFGGGADARMQAMIAGQLDAGIQQPRNIGPLTRAGGAILYEEAVPAPQEAWVVTREFFDEHSDTVCAMVKARIQGKQWAAEGSDRRANVEEARDIVMKHGIEPTDDELADWQREIEGNLSLDGGATVASLDKHVANLQSLDVVSADFDWRDHSDFSCVWEAQEELGLPQRPESY